MRCRTLLTLLWLVALGAVPAQAHGWMTKQKAEKYVKDVTRSDFGSLGVLASDARALCRLVGTSLGEYRVYRCAFGVRDRTFRYHGSVRVFPFRVEGNPETLYSLAYRWYRGACGALASGVPYAITTRRVKCPRARRWIGDWYSRGQHMPASYDCSLRSSPATARCTDGGRAFSFKFPE